MKTQKIHIVTTQKMMEQRRRVEKMVYENNKVFQPIEPIHFKISLKKIVNYFKKNNKKILNYLLS